MSEPETGDTGIHHGLRIFHVITGLKTGGAETVLCDLLECLRPPAFEHTVVALGPEGALSSRAAKSATVHHLGLRANRLLPGELVRLRGILKAASPDVIQGWLYRANLLALLAATGTHIPVVWGIHYSLTELARHKRGTRAVIRACRALSRFPDQIIYCSAAIAREHADFGYRREAARFIPNGFDVQRFKPDAEARASVRSELGIAPADFAVGLVARWHPIKDHGNFLRAAARMAENNGNAVFVAVGDGMSADNTELGALVHTLGLDKRVRLCGHRSDIPAINAALDVACSSSWGEAFPMAIGEAMACGTPCVATDVGDARDIIGETGIVVPARDPVALCTAWWKIANMNEVERRKLGLSARQRIIERYSLNAVANQYAAVYLDVAGKRSSCGALAK